MPHYIPHNGGCRPGMTQIAPGQSVATQGQIEAAIVLVRAAKMLREELGLSTDLDSRALDAILPPVNCRRTRLRLRRQTTGGTLP